MDTTEVIADRVIERFNRELEEKGKVTPRFFQELLKEEVELGGYRGEEISAKKTEVALLIIERRRLQKLGV